MKPPIQFKLYFEELIPPLKRGRVKGKAASRKFWTRSSKVLVLVQKRLAVLKKKREITIHLKWLFVGLALIQLMSLGHSKPTVYADPIAGIGQIKPIAPEKPLDVPNLTDAEPLQPVYIPPPVTISSFTQNSSYNAYDAGQCTWYAKFVRPDMPDNLGNADTWYERAASQGFAVGYAPRLGAVAAAIGYMHVAIVIGASGNTVTVREMNYQGPYIISERTTLASEFRYIY